MQLLTALAPFAPLAQTVLWMFLVVGLLIWFNKPIFAILVSLQRRIEAGSTVKAGWFEISDQLQPQTPETQRAKAQLELDELGAQARAVESTSEKVERSDTRAQYFLAEDLALRAIQADLGVPLNRHLSAGQNAFFDAAFIRDGHLHVVEVKHFLGSVTPGKLRTSLDRLASSVQRYGWKKVRIVLVLVYKREEDIEPNVPRVNKAIEACPFPVDIRAYALPDLQKRFGA